MSGPRTGRHQCRRAPGNLRIDAARAVLDGLAAGGLAARFDVDVAELRLKASDVDWAYGTGRPVVATAGELISLLSHRTLRDGRTLV